METITKPKRKVQYNLRTDPDLLEWLKDYATQHERPINYVINHAIKQLKKQVEVKA